ncbi:arylamine N-acetyltransferase family protein [Chryseobacterium jejuense]|uniref:arylamine N-acetyltransferase family protein n=1 Tax=Chryseobacterium jejuense TaxID=445960 RepID=UPI001AE19C88|nr:arylamine N-acetyltransferase [Chryseobacterium jejuense]MBP2619559.1 N-hydroxyarylamine O-acetyltransferase [Chryseobacterium jejuense]
MLLLLLVSMVNLQIEHIFEKLVHQQRGGYCYEQNLLLNYVLEIIGFQKKILLGRVLWKKADSSLSPKTHAFIIVSLDGKDYLVDTGFGVTTPCFPVPLISNAKNMNSKSGYRIVRNETFYTLEYWNKDWFQMYSFENEQSNVQDLEVANWYMSTNPQSGFVKNLIITRGGENGVYTLQNNQFKHRSQDGVVLTKLLQDPEKLIYTLRKAFNIQIEKAETYEILIRRIFGTNQSIINNYSSI